MAAADKKLAEEIENALRDGKTGEKISTTITADPKGWHQDELQTRHLRVVPRPSRQTAGG